MVKRVPRKDLPNGLRKNLSQVEIDGTRGSVIIDIGIKVEASVQEHR